MAARCKVTPLSAAVSPAGTWIARVDQVICGDGAYVTTVSDQVTLSRPRARREDATVIFSADEGGHPENHPTGIWRGSRALEIRMSHRSLVALSRAHAHDVVVDVVYTADR